MRQETRGLAVIILSLVLLFALVHAAGISEVSNKNDTYVINNKTETTPFYPQAGPGIDCSSYSNLKDRVKCRLQGGNDSVNTPEACRVLNNEEQNNCVSLYSKSKNCYFLDGENKDRCFRQMSHVGYLDSAEDRNLRNYMVLVLYDIEEKVESKYKDGSISIDDASEINTMIISIKQDILTNKGKNELKDEIAGLRIKLKSRDI